VKYTYNYHMQEGTFIRHRGLCLESERKTPNSFEALLDQYGVGMECDVFLLKDGNLAVMHNNDFSQEKRKLSQEEVENMTLEDLQKYHVIDRATNQEGGAVPLMDEYIWNAVDRGNPLTIEIKASTPERAEQTARALVAKIAQLKQEGAFGESQRRAEDPEELLSLHSFSVEALQAAQKEMVEQHQQFPLGLFWPSAPERARDMKISQTALEYVEYTEGKSMHWAETGIELAKKIGVQSINLQESNITPEVVDKAHALGLKVYAWVVNSPERAQQLIDMHVDHIITETQPSF